MTNIGEPKREIYVEPLEIPVPKEEPVEHKEPERIPEAEPEKVPVPV